MDTLYMRMAFRQALFAEKEDEVPVGAVIVRDEQILGQAHNQVEQLHDPTAHAEILAITQATQAAHNWRLDGATLYVTKEPCPMCAGAIVLARISRVVWGADDPKRGGAVSRFNILDSQHLNHRPTLTSGIMEDECRDLLQMFFRRKRGGTIDAMENDTGMQRC